MQTKEFNGKLIKILNSNENNLSHNFEIDYITSALKEILPDYCQGYEGICIDWLYIFLRHHFINIREITLDTLANKGTEYSDNNDRFINFHKGKLLCQDLFDTHELTARKVLMLLVS